MTDTSMKTMPRLEAEKLASEERKRRFIEVAHRAGVSENEADFDEAPLKIVRTKKAEG